MAKVLISIDDDLLRRIDERARQLGLTRSAYVARMARADVPGGEEREHRRRSIARARSLFAGLQVADTRDSTVLVRELRDER